MSGASYRLLLDPAEDELLGGGGAPEPAPQEAPEAAPPPEGGEGAPAQPQAQTPQEQWQSITEAARAYGVDLPYQDDQAALHALVSAYRRVQQQDPYAELGRRIAPYAPQVQQFLQQQQDQQRRPQQGFWNPPEFHESWMAYVDRDAQGNLVAKPGAPLGIVDKIAAYQDYVSDWARKLTTNPREALAPLVREIAQEVHQQNLGQYQQQATAQSVVQRHADWLFQKGPDGGALRDPFTGQPQLSPAGAMFRQFVAQAEQMGVRDVAAQERYALTALENHLLRARVGAGQQAAQQPPNQARNVGGPQATDYPARADVQPSGTPSSGGLSLTEMIRRDLKKAGVSEQEILADLQRTA